MSFKSAAFGLFQRFLPARYLVQKAGIQILLPYYHTISNETLQHVEGLYPAPTVARFEDDLDFILQNFEPVSLQELFEIIQTGNQPRKKVFHLTFDDGLREVYDFVFPILKSRGISATTFLNPDFVDNKDLSFRFKGSILAERMKGGGYSSDVQERARKIVSATQISWREALKVPYKNRELLDDVAALLDINFHDYAERYRPYMAASEISEMADAGFTFGGHSLDHPFYRELSVDEQLEQTVTSVNFVQSVFGQELRTFAFPFTDEGISEAFFEKAFAGNEKLDLTFGSDGSPLSHPPTHLRRFAMDASNDDGTTVIKKMLLKKILF